MITSTLSLGHSLPDTYTELLQYWPPRPIIDRTIYDNVLEIVTWLSLRRNQLNHDQSDYLKLLRGLIVEYDKKHQKIDTSHITPIKILESLVENNEMTNEDLGYILLGDHVDAATARSFAGKILNGDRKLNTSHIARLANRFKVQEGLFFDKTEK